MLVHTIRCPQPCAASSCSSASAFQSLLPRRRVAARSAADATAEGAWGSGDRHTLNSMYVPKRKQAKIIEVDHNRKRRDREVAEVVEAAKKRGMPKEQALENLASLEKLLPDLAPNLDKMKASDWARLVLDVNKVAAAIIVLKMNFPKANISKMVSVTPKVLLSDSAKIQADAEQVRTMLKSAEDVDAIVEAVPYLLDPRQLALSVSNLKRWFPGQDPIKTLQTNPSLLLSIEEADIAADPLYGDGGALQPVPGE